MNNNQRNLPHNFSLFTIHYSLFTIHYSLLPYYTQLMVANAVAIDVAIVATHLKTEITLFFFILHSSLFTIHFSLFTIPYSLFTIHYSLFTIPLINLPLLESSIHRLGYYHRCYLRQ